MFQYINQSHQPITSLRLHSMAPERKWKNSAPDKSRRKSYSMKQPSPISTSPTSTASASWPTYFDGTHDNESHQQGTQNEKSHLPHSFTAQAMSSNHQ
jgi:hypothetical protein